MKKEKNLSKLLYVFVVLSLIYTGYVLFYSYSLVSAYIQDNLLSVLISIGANVYQPLMITVILYALASMNDAWIRRFDKPEVTEETSTPETVEKKEKAEIPVESQEEVIETEEIIDTREE